MFIALVLILLLCFFSRDFVVFCLLENVVQISQSRRYFTIFSVPGCFPRILVLLLLTCYYYFAAFLICLYDLFQFRAVAAEWKKKRKTERRQKVKETTQTNKKKTERYNAGVAPLCTHTYQFFPPQIASKMPIMIRYRFDIFIIRSWGFFPGNNLVLRTSW